MIENINIPLWFWILVVVSLACFFCYYISPDRKGEPSKTQKVVATIWIIVRRIISFTGAAFCLFVAYIIWGTSESIFGSLAFILLSVFFTYVGIVGQGWNQYGFRDDLTLYNKIKKKYGLRW